VINDDREQRFRALYDMTRPRLIGFALRRARSADDAADIVAETFAIAWRRLDSVPAGDVAMLWLYATARNVAANQLRRHNREGDLVQRLGSQLRAATSETMAPKEESALAAARAFARLSEEDRELLMLVAWDGLSGDDLAALLGCSSTAARIRLHRARSRLAVELAAEEIEEKHGARTRHELSREPELAEGAEEG
jgi:RNA polymerase sigma-70 factor (ECF subfamily)